MLIDAKPKTSDSSAEEYLLSDAEMVPISDQGKKFLSDWVISVIKEEKGVRSAARAVLGSNSPKSIQDWRDGKVSSVTGGSIKKIASYRTESLEDTILWLSGKPLAQSGISLPGRVKILESELRLLKQQIKKIELMGHHQRKREMETMRSLMKRLLDKVPLEEIQLTLSERNITLDRWHEIIDGSDLASKEEGGQVYQVLSAFLYSISFSGDQTLSETEVRDELRFPHTWDEFCVRVGFPPDDNEGFDDGIVKRPKANGIK